MGIRSGVLKDSRAFLLFWGKFYYFPPSEENSPPSEGSITLRRSNLRSYDLKFEGRRLVKPAYGDRFLIVVGLTLSIALRRSNFFPSGRNYRLSIAFSDREGSIALRRSNLRKISSKFSFFSPFGRKGSKTPACAGVFGVLGFLNFFSDRFAIGGSTGLRPVDFVFSSVLRTEEPALRAGESGFFDLRSKLPTHPRLRRGWI